MEMTADRLLHRNGDLKDPDKSELMEVIRRFHALSRTYDLPYCVVGDMAVIRNGLLRTTGDIDILTLKKEWRKILPLKGEISGVGEYDEKKGACFIGLHDLVQLKMTVSLSKLKEYGPATAAKDLGDVQGLMKNNLSKFSMDIVGNHHPAVRKQCREAFEEVARAEKSKKRARRDIEG